MKLSGKVGLVTGGGAGIGRGIAEELAQEGASVAIADIDGRRAEDTKSALKHAGAASLAIEADVSRRDDVERMVARCVRELGGLDILVNNAGIAKTAPFLELTDEVWDEVLNTNLKAVFMASQSAARYMVSEKIQGRIINISSVDEVLPFPHNLHYNASKAGVHILTKSMALALADHGITVNNIGPGIIESEMTRDSITDEAWLKGMPVKIPLGRVGKPADIGRAAVFLASEDASYVTGTTLYVDGGHMISGAWQIMKMFRPAKR